MLSDAESIASALGSTFLAGHDVVEVPVPHSSSVTFAVPYEAADTLPAWQAARSALDRIGRWPVAGCMWGPPPGSYVLGDPDRVRAGAVLDPDSICQAAEALDVDAVRSSKRSLPMAAPPLEVELRWTEYVFGAAPTAESVRDALGPGAAPLDNDRYLMAWEAARPDFVARTERFSSGISWFEPHEPTAILLLPTERS